MEDLITCGICNEPYDSDTRTPLILNCGHTICRTCLTNLYSNSQTIICPFDRQRDNRDLDSLFKNRSVLALLEHVNASKGNGTCCSVHPWKQVKFYCNAPCQAMVCKICLLNHNGHNLVNPFDESDWGTFQQTVTARVSTVNTLANQINESLAILQAEKANLEEKKVAMMVQLRSTVDRLMVRLGEIHNEIANRIEQCGRDLQAQVDAYMDRNYATWQSYMKLAQDVSVCYQDFIQHSSNGALDQIQKLPSLESLLITAEQNTPSELPPATSINLPDRLVLTQKDVRSALEQILQDDTLIRTTP